MSSSPVSSPPNSSASISSAASTRARAYRALHPVSLTVQLAVLLLAEAALFASYSAHEARFHWATHFLVGLTAAALFLLVWLLVTGRPGPLPLLTVLAFHLYAMAPDLLFRGGVPHDGWMDVFLGHLVVHHVPGGDQSWLVVAVGCSGAYATALSLWLRARWSEVQWSEVQRSEVRPSEVQGSA